MAERARVATSSWGGLTALADPTLFEIHYDGIAAAIAYRFALKTHYAIAELQDAYAVWIARCAADGGARDHRHFITVIGLLIESLASHAIVSYSVMMRRAGKVDPHLEVLLKYPNEATALIAGAATYAVPITRLTGEDPSVPLSALILDNAAGTVRRRPEAAMRFRELLQLGTPWG